MLRSNTTQCDDCRRQYECHNCIAIAVLMRIIAEPRSESYKNTRHQTLIRNNIIFARYVDRFFKIIFFSDKLAENLQYNC